MDHHRSAAAWSWSWSWSWSIMILMIIFISLHTPHPHQAARKQCSTPCILKHFHFDAQMSKCLRACTTRLRAIGIRCISWAWFLFNSPQTNPKKVQQFSKCQVLTITHRQAVTQIFSVGLHPGKSWLYLKFFEPDPRLFIALHRSRWFLWLTSPATPFHCGWAGSLRL